MGTMGMNFNEGFFVDLCNLVQQNSWKDRIFLGDGHAVGLELSRPKGSFMARCEVIWYGPNWVPQGTNIWIMFKIMFKIAGAKGLDVLHSHVVSVTSFQKVFVESDSSCLISCHRPWIYEKPARSMFHIHCNPAFRWFSHKPPLTLGLSQPWPEGSWGLDYFCNIWNLTAATRRWLLKLHPEVQERLINEAWPREMRRTSGRHGKTMATFLRERMTLHEKDGGTLLSDKSICYLLLSHVGTHCGNPYQPSIGMCNILQPYTSTFTLYTLWILALWNLWIHIWGFPQMGIPPTPCIFGVPHFRKPPYFSGLFLVRNVHIFGGIAAQGDLGMNIACSGVWWFICSSSTGSFRGPLAANFGRIWYTWLVVWNMLYFFHILGILNNDLNWLTLFQRCWNHQSDTVHELIWVYMSWYELDVGIPSTGDIWTQKVELDGIGGCQEITLHVSSSVAVASCLKILKRRSPWYQVAWASTSQRVNRQPWYMNFVGSPSSDVGTIFSIAISGT